MMFFFERSTPTSVSYCSSLMYASLRNWSLSYSGSQEWARPANLIDYVVVDHVSKYEDTSATKSV